VIIMFCLPFSDFFNEIYKRSLLLLIPYFWMHYLALMASFFCLKSSVASNKIEKFAENWNNRIEINRKRTTNKRNRISKVINLKLGFRCNISISDSCCCYNKFIKKYIVFRNGSLLISKSKYFISKHDQTQEEILNQSKSCNTSNKLEYSS
jgi:hypothetical protein